MKQAILFCGILAILASSCKKNSDTIDNPLNPTDSTIHPVDTTHTSTSHDSTFLLTSVTNSGGVRLSLHYDTVKKRYSSWSKTYTAWYDSSVIYYNAQGRILSIVRKENDMLYLQKLTPTVFEYNSAGYINKIFHKAYKGFYEADYAYLTSVSYPLNIVYPIERYDSLNYDAANRVKSIYTIEPTGSSTHITAYKTISYANSNDNAISEIIVYSLNNSGGYDNSPLTFNSYNSKTNPYYKAFHSLCFVGESSSLTELPLLPDYYFGYITEKYLTVTPYLCTQINFGAPINYAYNADGLVSTCWYGNATTDWVKFFYTKYEN
jgi:hypothetical protein